ncbi:HAD family hydrolase [Planktotalea sp.]|uniref:HAD family hydrolase n=1 Tax=Planktotalea sp. TaxID=2029877 RepID=UPI0025DDEB65|nr:HAD family hydrolase [Planktotalea sp.]
MSGVGDTFKAILFDKDGTLFDFRATWDAWAADFLPQLCGGKDNVLRELAAELGFDLKTLGFLASSMVIASSNREVAQVIARILKRTDIDALELEMAASSAKAPLVPVIALAPFLQGLKSRGYKLGVMTNDVEAVAEAHLQTSGVRDLFDFVCGSDSGFGAKPDPEPLLAFCSHVHVDPFHTVMLGDSTHDLIAAHAAGMAALGVLTGVARAAELAPHADAVLSDISQLPEWLVQMSARK